MQNGNLTEADRLSSCLNKDITEMVEKANAKVASIVNEMTLDLKAEIERLISEALGKDDSD